MNILHISPAYYPATYWGGTIFADYGLNNALARLPDVNLRVLTTDTAGPKIADRLDVRHLDMGLFPRQEVLFARRVAGACVSSEMLRNLPSLIGWADVVHLTATYSFPTLPTLFLCLLMNKPLVWSPHGAILDAHEWAGAPRKRLKRIWEWCCNALIRHEQVIAHVTSKSEREAVEARVPRARTVIVPNGVDVPDTLPARTWLPDGKLRLLFIGRISPKKGIENLLLAVRELDDPNISLTIYGTGPKDYEASVKRLADELNFRDGVVTFAGHVDGEAKNRAFLSADVCVVPSFSENFCIVVAEALAHGMPVIASHGTPWRRVEEKECGLWVDNSPESLTKAIIQIRSMPLSEMGTRGNAWMAADYGWNTIAALIKQVYNDMAMINTNKTER